MILRGRGRTKNTPSASAQRGVLNRPNGYKLLLFSLLITFHGSRFPGLSMFNVVGPPLGIGPDNNRPLTKILDVPPSTTNWDQERFSTPHGTHTRETNQPTNQQKNDIRSKPTLPKSPTNTRRVASRRFKDHERTEWSRCSQLAFNFATFAFNFAKHRSRIIRISNPFSRQPDIIVVEPPIGVRCWLVGHVRALSPKTARLCS